MFKGIARAALKVIETRKAVKEFKAGLKPKALKDIQKAKINFTKKYTFSGILKRMVYGEKGRSPVAKFKEKNKRNFFGGLKKKAELPEVTKVTRTEKVQKIDPFDLESTSKSDMRERLIFKVTLYEQMKDDAKAKIANKVRYKGDKDVSLLEVLSEDNINSMSKRDLKTFELAINQSLESLGVKTEDLEKVMTTTTKDDRLAQINEIKDQYAYEEFMKAWENNFFNSDDASLPADMDERKALGDEITATKTYGGFTSRGMDSQEDKEIRKMLEENKDFSKLML